MKIGMSIFGEISHEKVASLLKKNGIDRSFIGSETEDFD